MKFIKRKNIYCAPNVLPSKAIINQSILAGSVVGKSVHENTKVKTTGQEVETHDFSNFIWD